MTVTLYNANDEPIKNAAFTFTISLVSQADTDIFKTTPTLAAGDVTISKDGGNFANIGTLPTQIQTSGVLSVALTAAEMNADRVDVLFRDAAGAEWQDAQVTIFTKVAVSVGTSDAPDVSSDVTSIKAKTDNLPASPSAVGSEMTLEDNAITAAKIATDAIDADALATDALGALELAAGAGSEIAAAVWAAATRTLTQTAAQITSTLSGSTITAKRGDTLSVSLTGLGSLANVDKLYFTVKESLSSEDSSSIIQIEEGAGLLYINKAAAGTAGNGSISIDDAGDGDITISLAAIETAKLSLNKYSYDVQIVRSSGVPVSTLSEGVFMLEEDVTRVIT